MRKTKRSRISLIFFLIAVLLVGSVVVAASIASASEMKDEGSLFHVSNEIVFAFACLFVVFVLALLLMVIITFSRRSMLKNSVQYLGESAQDTIDKTLKAAKNAANDTDAEKELEPRFFMLNEIDEKMRNREREVYNAEITLSEMCEQFREFASYRLHLYYSIEDIRRFIANMASTHVLIMQGMSGTGKTSLAYAFGEFIMNPSAIVPIQPMWKERSDLVGYYNEFTKRFNETVLLQKMYEANYKDDVYIVVLDEMNIARVEYYFAEFLSLLEIPRADRRYIDVVSDVWESDPKLLKNGQLKLPKNMWFIGTANNDDSTFAISDKVYDRAMIMNLDKKAEVFEGKAVEGVRISAAHFELLTEKAKKEYRLTGRNRRRLKQLDEYMIEKFKITFGNRIMKQIDTYIPTYIACGGDEVDALDDIISKKVLRKLETQNPIYVRNNVEALCTYLDDLFGYDRMALCKAYLSKFERSA